MLKEKVNGRELITGCYRGTQHILVYPRLCMKFSW